MFTIIIIKNRSMYLMFQAPFIKICVVMVAILFICFDNLKLA